MKDGARKCFVQAYNAQAAVDAHQQVIVAAELTQEVNDSHQLLPMIQAAEQAAGQKAATITADAGYWDTIALRDPALEGIEMLVAPDRPSRSKDEPVPPGVATNEESQKMRALLATEAGQAKYGLRKTTVEPVFGQIKEVRGIRRLRLRGFARASSEWKLICATHNLLKLFRSRKQPSLPKRAKHKPNDSRHSCQAFCQHQRPTRYRRLLPKIFVAIPKSPVAPLPDESVLSLRQAPRLTPFPQPTRNLSGLPKQISERERPPSSGGDEGIIMRQWTWRKAPSAIVRMHSWLE